MSERFAAGSMISHYRIVSRLGAGGMGEVFKAQDVTLDRPVALKILPPDLVRNEDRVRRFVQEAKAASSLSHPHIVAIHEVGEVPLDANGTTRYIVMEFVNGVTLRTKIYDTHSTLKELLEYLGQAADALAKAHAAGIVHRDLKPDNIMVTQDGYAKVLDFGLAKLVEKRLPSSGSGSRTEMREQTREGVVLGTLGYMSPEQVRGQQIDHRSDIFSFGCILYEAVTKQKPFVADSDIDVLHKIVHDDPPAVSEVNPKAPSEVRRMIRRCLAKDPEKRYQSMKDVAIELRDLSQEFDTLGSWSGPSAPVAALRMPSWWVRWLPAALAVIGIAALIAALALRRPVGPVTKAIEGTVTPLTSQTGIESHPKISPDGRFVIFVSHAAGNFDIYLQRLGGLNPINLTANSPATDTHPAFSPDGQLIAFRSDRQGGGIFVMGATGESVRRVTDFGYHPVWSPDGTEIVCSTANFFEPLSRGTYGELWRVDIQTGEKRKIAETDAVQPSWSPHGKRIAFWGVSDEGGVRDIWTIPANGGERVAATKDSPADWNPVWAPDGRHLYFISNRGGTMNLWRVAIDEDTGATQGAPQPVTTPARNIGYIDFAADGKKLVFAGLDVRSDLDRLSFDPSTGVAVGAPAPVVRGSLRAIQADVSPDGQWLAFRTEGEREDIYVVRTDGTETRKLTDDEARDRAPDWSPDGTRIAFYSDRSGRYEVWSIGIDGGHLQQMTSLSGPSIWFPRWSPDGTRMAIHNELGSYLFSLNGALPAKKLDPLPPFSKDLTFRVTNWSPDGKWLCGHVTKRNEQLPSGVTVYSLERREYQRLTDSGGNAVFLSDGRRLLYRDRTTGEISLVNRETGKTSKIAKVEERYILGTQSFVDKSTDDRNIYFSRGSAEADVWLLTLN